MGIPAGDSKMTRCLKKVFISCIYWPTPPSVRVPRCVSGRGFRHRVRGGVVLIYQELNHVVSVQGAAEKCVRLQLPRHWWHHWCDSVTAYPLPPFEDVYGGSRFSPSVCTRGYDSLCNYQRSRLHTVKDKATKAGCGWTEMRAFYTELPVDEAGATLITTNCGFDFE